MTKLTRKQAEAIAYKEVQEFIKEMRKEPVSELPKNLYFSMDIAGHKFGIDLTDSIINNRG